MKSAIQFLFATGVENSYPTIAGGVRIDQMDKCGHYARWEEDFELVRETGVNALRYGPAYYRVHTAPDHFDWEICDPQMHRLRDLGITVIADLCHFGVPTWLGGFQDPAFPILFAEYARAFARRYPWIQHFTPVHEIFVAADNSALKGRWNECETSERSFVRAIRNLCMAHELAVEAILSERPDAIIVQSESIDHVHAAGRDAQPLVDRMNGIKHLSLDLTMGRELAPGMARFLNEHGVTSNDLSFFRERRAVGQRWLNGDYERYRAPLFHCETNRGSQPAVDWLDAQWSEVLALRAARIPVMGFSCYSLTDRISWQRTSPAGNDDLYAAGMYDLQRRIRPVGVRYGEIIAEWRETLDRGADTAVSSLAG